MAVCLSLLGGKLDALPKKVRETARIPLGNFRGLGFGIVLHSQFAPEIYLEGATTRLATLSAITTGHGPSLTPWNGWPTATAPNATASSEISKLRNRNFAIIRPDWASPFRTMPTWPN